MCDLLPVVIHPSAAPHLSDIIHCPPEKLSPWPNNPRKHSKRQLAPLTANIKKNGVMVPLIVDERGVVICGHGRLMVALKLGLKTVPVRVLVGWTEAQKRHYLLSDNRLAELSEWDLGLLTSELELLIAQEVEYEDTGFSTGYVDQLVDKPEKPAAGDPDDLQPADIPAEITTRLGDLWQVGNHSIYCGSALDESSYRLLMGDAIADMVISDPPYNVKIQGHVGGSGKKRHREFPMASGEMDPSQFTAFLAQALRLLHVFSKDGGIHFYFMDWRHLREILDGALPHFGAPKQVCIWVKDNAGMGSFYRSQHELVLVFKKGDAPHINNFGLGENGRYRTNVWQYPGVNTFTNKGFEQLDMHPTVKPVGLIADAIRDCSHRKGIVLDAFAGSGTTLIAAERTGRHARAIELDPQYVDVSLMRWQRITGKAAILVATGQTWDEVRRARLGTADVEGSVERLNAEENDDDV